MSRRLNFLLSLVLLTLSSCCVCAERGNHAIRRCWFDYNTLRAPAIVVEQYDHLPYCAPQVGYYRWMYDKDPGHQMACLGTFPTPVCKSCNCPELPADDDPFGYQVLFPKGLPGDTESLWNSKLPEPINVPRGPTALAAPGSSGSPMGPVLNQPSSGKPSPNPGAPIPMVPVPSLSNPAERAPTPQTIPTEPVSDPRSTVPPLPNFPMPSPNPVPRPVQEIPPPAFGPGAPQDSTVRLTTGQSRSQAAAARSGPSLTSPQ